MISKFETKSKLLKALEGLEVEFVWKWLIFSIAVGLVAGSGAILFDYLLRLTSSFFLEGLGGYTPPTPEHPFYSDSYSWLLLLAPVIGGLISGFLVFTFAPEAEGHGTDAMVDSFHRKRGIIRKRVPLIKTIASVVTIGSGGSAGKEGPIAQIGAGFGSYLATLFRLSDRDRRILLLAGTAGGIGAIFRAPLGAAIFACEVLYRDTEIEYEGLLPSILSSIVAYSVFTSFYASGPLFKTPRLTFSHPVELLFYAIFGLICAGVGYIYIRFFYGVRDRFFRLLRIDDRLKPAIGGLMLGLLALYLPQVLGGGYGWIQMAIDGKLALYSMLLFAFAKILATSFTISSGGSGGVFAPSLFIGAMLGGFFGGVVSRLFPDTILMPNAFVMVGMGGFFAGVAKVPIASLIMVSEMAESYGLLVPMMLVSAVSFLFLRRATLYEKQVPTRVDSPAHQGDFAVDLLRQIKVRDAMPKDRKPVLIPEAASIEEVLKFVSETTFSNFPVIDRKGRMIGIISLNDMRRVIFDEEVLRGLVIARDISTPEVVTISLDDDLSAALKGLTMVNVDDIPVVDPKDPTKVVGMLTRKDILSAYHRELMRLRAS